MAEALVAVTPAFVCLLVCLSACSWHPTSTTAKATQIMDDFTLTRTTLGQKQWVLRAHQAMLPEEGADIRLDAPDADIIHESKPPTHVKADHGLFKQQSQDIHLSSHVVVVTHNAEDAGPTTLHTEILDYSSAKKEFTTDQPVEIDREGSVMHGIGMVSNQDLTEIHILHQQTTFQ